jgi:hypothetical protein
MPTARDDRRLRRRSREPISGYRLPKTRLPRRLLATRAAGRPCRAREGAAQRGGEPMRKQAWIAAVALALCMSGGALAQTKLKFAHVYEVSEP